MLLLKIKHVLSAFKSLQQVVSCRLIHKKKTNMEGTKTAYFHLSDGSDKFKVSFLYINECVRVSRQFNFERQVEETVHSFLTRVSSNLEKVVKNKMNRKRKKTESGEEEESAKIVVELVSEGSTLIPDTALCKDIFFSNKYPTGSLILRMIGLDYVVAINSPWIDSMDLPDSMMAGFPVYTHSFETKFTDKSLSTFVWMKSLKKNTSSTEPQNSSTMNEHNDQWSKVGEGFIYIPSVADIGHKLKLKCTPKNSSTSGPPLERETSSVVEAGPGQCPFDERHLYTQQKTSKESFRVVSYNILADVYSSTTTAQNELFSYCPTYALAIDYRKQLFLKELLGYNADLVCLQEVDTRVFDSDLVPVLGEQGLVGVHAKKSTISEGVASFYSSSKFKLLEVQEVVLSQELLNKSYCSHILACVDTNAQLKERVVGLGSAALALTLESLDRKGELLVLGNTHLYFHPDADHIRLLQGAVVLAFLNDVVSNVKQKNPGQPVSLICCGDFNSVPECGIYKLMTTKSVPADFVDWKSKPEEEVVGLSLSQPFNMDSACGTPLYTNYTVSFAACLDYIYYQTDRLAVEAVVPFPSDEVLREHRAIPSVVFPSDHVALVAELLWKK